MAPNAGTGRALVTADLDEAAVAAIERACGHLVLKSIRVFDEQDWLAYASLFTEDGVFLRASLPDEPLAGREAIRAALAARSATRLTRHLCTNIEIDVVTAERAESRCYLLLYAGDASHAGGSGGRPADALQRVGEYHDALVRTREGWRIARRVGRLIFHT